MDKNGKNGKTVNGEKIVNKSSRGRKKGATRPKKVNNCANMESFVRKYGGIVLNAEANQLGDIERIDRVVQKWERKKGR